MNNDVYATVKDTNLVEPVSVEITDGGTGNGKTLTVTVQEKWSLFPVPFGGITNDKWAVGAAVIEANFLGLGDTAMLVGSFGSDSWMGSVMYMKSPKAAGEFGFSVMGMFMYQDAEHTDQAGKDILRRFNKLSINPEISASNPVVNLFSAKYSTLSYAAASVGLEKYLFTFFLGNVFLAAGYQAAHSDGFLHNQFDHGSVATAQVYFSKVALPGKGRFLCIKQRMRMKNM